MLRIVSGSFTAIRVSWFVSAFDTAREDLSRFSSWISGSLWFGLFICLFLRKIWAGVAMQLPNLSREPGIIQIARLNKKNQADRAATARWRVRSLITLHFSLAGTESGEVA